VDYCQLHPNHIIYHWFYTLVEAGDLKTKTSGLILSCSDYSL
jgi:hypothetical protein